MGTFAKASQEEIALALEIFRRKYPKGILVQRWRLMNPLADYDKEYRTRSEVFFAESLDPVVFLEGFAGYVHIHSLVPLEVGRNEAIAPVMKVVP